MNASFTPVPSRQQTGWTAEKQRLFIETLAATGSVTEAATRVFMTARSAYYLRSRPQAEAFARAWDKALRIAAPRLVSQAFDRALNGNRRRIWKNGDLIVEESIPSDRLLMWLITRMGPAAFPAATPPGSDPETGTLEAEMAQFTDLEPDCPGLSWEDMQETPESPFTNPYADTPL